MSAAPDGGVSTDMGTHLQPGQPAPAEAQSRGPLFDLAPDEQFRTLDQMVRRQELLAKNRLACDTHWTRIKLGYPWSALEKSPDKDEYKATLPPGTDRLRIAAVPNKYADLLSKIVETIMVDPPAPDPHAETDAEQSERAAEMAKEFLTQDGSEAGTNDAAKVWAALDAAMTRACAFLHPWVDAQGGGSVPLQIKAHPQAVDVQNPLVGPDGMPTTDYVLRYVTPQRQFTDDPGEADRQWNPKTCVDVLYREHVRVFPETAEIEDAESVILLWYCTLGEAKRRWPDVADMSPDQQAQLLDWTPLRYLALLPPALRTRWKQAMTGTKETAVDDERTLFYYLHYRRATPTYPEGMILVSSGAAGGTTLYTDTLTAEVPHPDGGTDHRRLDIPLVPIRPIADVDDRDPMGRAMGERFGGANEAASTLATSYLEAIQVILNPAKFIPATSPVTGDDIEQSRGSGDPVIVLTKDDYPHYEEPRPMPPNFLDVMQWQHEQMNSASGVTKPAMGADDQQEVSGVARNIAVRQALVSLSRVQQAVLAAYGRYWRVKLQLATKYMTTPQQLRYVGEDGAYKQAEWTGVDFAQVTDVKVQPGTGTMMPPAEKVNFLATLKSQGFIAPDEAADAARPAFSESMGLKDNTSQQRVERQVSAWLHGPPQGWQPSQPAVDPLTGQPQLDPMSGQPAMTPPTWTPFQPLPCDDEPVVAQLRQVRLRKLMESVRFAAQPPAWQALVVQEYQRMRQAVALAMQPAIPAPKTTIAMTGDAATVGAEEQAAMHPQAAPQSSTNPPSQHPPLKVA